jgi:hypothetical protein
MVNQDNLNLLIHLAKYPEEGKPIDFQVVATLLDTYPDFDLLRKVFVEQGMRFGAKGAHFLKEQELWNMKQQMLTPVLTEQESIKKMDSDFEPFDKKATSFIRTFATINKPLNLPNIS